MVKEASTLISYIIGTDADTILDNNCSSALINKIANEDSQTVGIVGIVDIVKTWNPLVIYQYYEYLYAQCLKRYIQSNITHKVSCLSGCVQLITVCKETCGNDILNEFNKLPKENENILHHIRSYASEDRNHVCLMFSMYPYVKTFQSLEAISYTNVPNTLMKFIRQRKRWCAGAATNDLLLLANVKHNKWERIQSFVNVLMFCLTIFVYIATIVFLIAIINSPTYLMLYLSIIMLIPVLYSLYIPIGIYNGGEREINRNYKYKFIKIIYYWSGFILYYILGPCISLIVNIYTFYYLDDLNWNGKHIINNDIDIECNLNIGNNINTSQGFDYTKKIKFRKGFLICSLKYLKEDKVTNENNETSTDNNLYDNNYNIETVPITPISSSISPSIITSTNISTKPTISNILNLHEIENNKHNDRYIDVKDDNYNKQHFTLLIDELKSKILIKKLKPLEPSEPIKTLQLTNPSSSNLESPILEQPDIDVNQMWDSRSI